jgi:hypothetical protein
LLSGGSARLLYQIGEYFVITIGGYCLYVVDRSGAISGPYLDGFDIEIWNSSNDPGISSLLCYTIMTTRPAPFFNFISPSALFNTKPPRMPPPMAKYSAIAFAYRYHYFNGKLLCEVLPNCGTEHLEMFSCHPTLKRTWTHHIPDNGFNFTTLFVGSFILVIVCIKGSASVSLDVIDAATGDFLHRLQDQMRDWTMCCFRYLKGLVLSASGYLFGIVRNDIVCFDARSGRRLLRRECCNVVHDSESCKYDQVWHMTPANVLSHKRSRSYVTLHDHDRQELLTLRFRCPEGSHRIQILFRKHRLGRIHYVEKRCPGSNDFHPFNRLAELTNQCWPLNWNWRLLIRNAIYIDVSRWPTRSRTHPKSDRGI